MIHLQFSTAIPVTAKAMLSQCNHYAFAVRKLSYRNVKGLPSNCKLVHIAPLVLPQSLRDAQTYLWEYTVFLHGVDVSLHV